MLRAVLHCSPGLEATVQRECEAFKVKALIGTSGRLRATVTAKQLFKLNLFLRTADRVVIDNIVRFKATTFSDLELALKRLRREKLGEWLSDGVEVDVKSVVNKCQLFHTGAIEERARKFLAAPKAKGRPRDLTMVRHASGELSHVLAEAPGAAPPKHVVHLEGSDDWFTVALDTSGAPLHHRGWRDDAAKMPLKSTHAAAILLNAGWASPHKGYLVDPFCGSGSIAIEAAQMAVGLPPHFLHDGSRRRFAFEDFNCVDGSEWIEEWAEALEHVEDRAKSALKYAAAPSAPVRIFASDRDEGAIHATRNNAKRAGVGLLVEAAHGAISNLEAPKRDSAEAQLPCLLLTNPPWGLRSANGAPASGDAPVDLQMRSLYQRFGTVFTEKWSLGVLVNNLNLSKLVLPDLDSNCEISIGGHRTWLSTRLKAELPKSTRLKAVAPKAAPKAAAKKADPVKAAVKKAATKAKAAASKAKKAAAARSASARPAASSNVDASSASARSAASSASARSAASSASARSAALPKKAAPSMSNLSYE